MRWATSRSSRETESIWMSSSRRFLMRSWLTMRVSSGEMVSAPGRVKLKNGTAGLWANPTTRPTGRATAQAASAAHPFERALQLVALGVEGRFVGVRGDVDGRGEADADAREGLRDAHPDRKS